MVDSEERAQTISRARTSNAEFHRRAALGRLQAAEASRRQGEEGGEAGGQRTLPVIVKADVQGSAEAVRDAVAHLVTEHVKVQVSTWGDASRCSLQPPQGWLAGLLVIMCLAHAWCSVAPARSARIPSPTQGAPNAACLCAQVVHVGVGPVSQSDVQLAVPLGAKILGFNVRPAGADVEALAKQHDVEVGVRGGGVGQRCSVLLHCKLRAAA